MYCEFCGEQLGVIQEEIDTHKNVFCIESPQFLENIAKVKAEEKQLIFDRQNAIKSYNDIFELLDTEMYKEGFAITWTKKPSSFSTDIDYTHRNLIIPDKKLAGWTGSFRGSIEWIGDNEDYVGTPKSENKNCRFWDLSGEMSGRYNFGFLRTNGGSWGGSFDGNGVLLIQDFPQLYKLHIGEVTQRNTQTNVDNIINKFQDQVTREERELLGNSGFLKESERIVKQLHSYIEKLNTTKTRYKTHLLEDYRASVTVTLPDISDCIIDMGKYNAFKVKYGNVSSEESKTFLNTNVVEGLLNSLTEELKSFNAFQSEHAEYFV